MKKIEHRTKKKISNQNILILLALLLCPTNQNSCGSSCLDCNQISNSQDFTCSKCNVGYMLSEGKCIACEVDGCSSCNSNSVECKSCRTGWFNSTSPGYGPRIELVYKCTPCVKGCQICSNNLNCNLCQPGFMSTEDNRCELQNNKRVVYLMIFAAVALIGLTFFIMKQTRHINAKKKEEKERKKKEKEMKEKEERLKKRKDKENNDNMFKGLPGTDREVKVDAKQNDEYLVTMGSLNFETFKKEGIKLE